jgi:hypothetical protein
MTEGFIVGEAYEHTNGRLYAVFIDSEGQRYWNRPLGLEGGLAERTHLDRTETIVIGSEHPGRRPSHPGEVDRETTYSDLSTMTRTEVEHAVYGLGLADPQTQAARHRSPRSATVIRPARKLWRWRCWRCWRVLSRRELSQLRVASAPPVPPPTPQSRFDELKTHIAAPPPLPDLPSPWEVAADAIAPAASRPNPWREFQQTMSGHGLNQLQILALWEVRNQMNGQLIDVWRKFQSAASTHGLSIEQIEVIFKKNFPFQDDLTR